MREIALIRVNFETYYDGFKDIEKAAIQGISAWAEVSDKEFELLSNYCRRHGYTGDSWVLVEKPINLQDEVDSIIQKAKLDAKKEAEKAAAKALKRQIAADKREAKKREQELEILKKLQEKYENEK